MTYISKEQYENLDNQRTVRQMVWEMAMCLHTEGVPVNDAFPLVPYLLYKASTYSDPFSITLHAIVNNGIGINRDVSALAKKVLNNKVWERLLQMVTKYTTEDFALATVYPMAENDPKGTMSTPDSIIKLAHKLLDVKQGERVADVCCGSGTYMVSAALEEEEASYHGFELNVSNGTAAMMRAELLDADVQVTLCDVFSLMESKLEPKYDKIFANYPFGLKVRNFEAGASYLKKLTKQYSDLSRTTSSDWLFNALLCDLLAEGGKAIGIMTNGSTWNSIDTPMRKHFVERKMVECVISLPGKLFAGTGIPTTLIVLSHGNERVRMIDATELCQQGRRQNEFSEENINTILEAITKDNEYSRSISIEELRKNEYSLNLYRYTSRNLAFGNGVPFESIIKSISRGAPCTASQLDEMVSDSVTNMQYLMLANIQNGMIDDKLPYLSYIDPKYEKYCLKNNELILSKNGLPYKVAVASVKDGQRILANGNLYIIELDETKADPYYIKAFFDSEPGHAVLKGITVGATMPNIGVDKLKKVEIPLPAMEEQKRVAQKYQTTMNEIASIKLQLEDAINRLHNILNVKGK